MSDQPQPEPQLRGHPTRGLVTATMAFFAGLTTIVFYGVAGPSFKDALDLTGGDLGLLLASPHVSKALLRVPFGAWVDEVGGKRPFLWLLMLSVVGLAGVSVTLLLYYPTQIGSGFFALFFLFGVIGGAGGATFSVGVPQTAYWFPIRRQGFALGVYAGAGNIGPGVFNLLIPLLIGAIGLAGAYVSWLGFMVVVTLTYALVAVDPFSFQLAKQDLEPNLARRIARQRGQEVFPSGSTWGSLRQAATTPRTWVLVVLYMVSFGGGFTALTAWFPTYWSELHEVSLVMAGGLAAAFTVYGSLIRIPGGSLSDRLGGELVAIASFLVMAAGGAILTMASGPWLAIIGMLVLGTGMGVANGAIFKLVPVYVPEAVGGASGWIGGVGGLGTLIVLPILGAFTDSFGSRGYAWGFSIFIVLSLSSALIAYLLHRAAGPPSDGPGAISS